MMPADLIEPLWVSNKSKAPNINNIKIVISKWVPVPKRAENIILFFGGINASTLYAFHPSASFEFSSSSSGKFV